jgi:hypothetical protein
MSQIVTIIIIAILLYLGFLGQFYLPSYFKKKGENLAQSQDIEKLTLKIDSIKQEFVERTEYLKARLDFSTQLQLSHIDEERNAIMNYLRAFTNYNSLCNDTTLGGINDYNNSELSPYRLLLDGAYNQTRITKAILKVFVDDNEFYDLAAKITKELLRLELAVKHLLGELELNNINLEHNRSDFENPNQSENHQNLLNERAQFYANQREQIIALPDSFYTDMTIFNSMLRKHLTKSIEQIHSSV